MLDVPVGTAVQGHLVPHVMSEGTVLEEVQTHRATPVQTLGFCAGSEEDPGSRLF